jgi:hypothetical protein
MEPDILKLNSKYLSTVGAVLRQNDFNMKTNQPTPFFFPLYNTVLQGHTIFFQKQKVVVLFKQVYVTICV